MGNGFVIRNREVFKIHSAIVQSESILMVYLKAPWSVHDKAMEVYVANTVAGTDFGKGIISTTAFFCFPVPLSKT